MHWALLFFISLISHLEANVDASTSHPFHVSVAELEFNKETGCLEVALKVWPEDLEKALSRVTKSPVDLDKTPKLDELIFAYLKKNISVSSDGSKKSPIKWIGKEIEIRHAWLYFEINTKSEPTDFHFSNTIFFELQDDQINIFNLKLKKGRASISFAKDNSSRKLTAKDFVPVRNPFANRK